MKGWENASFNNGGSGSSSTGPAGMPAQAELITIQIEGVVDTVEDDGEYLEDQINPGDIITGWYTYDTDTPDTNPSENVGDYEHFSTPYGVSLTIGGFTFTTDPANVDFLVELVNNNPSGDDYLFTSYNNHDLANGTTVEELHWSLNDPAGMLFPVLLSQPHRPFWRIGTGTN